LVDSDVKAAMSRLKSYQALAMIEFSRAIWPNQTELESVFDVAATKAGDLIRRGKPAGDLVQAISEERRPHVFRALAWLVKLGVFRLVTQGLNQEQHS